jgi:putative ABC transport system ATP-binding protein
MALLTRLNQERGITILIVTHDGSCAAHARRRVQFMDGRIVNDSDHIQEPLV